MEQNIKLLISAGFKNSTQTLLHTFNKILEGNVKKTHGFPWEYGLEHIQYDFILIPFRNNNDVFVSAFFQDILEQSYIYSPFHESNYLSEYRNLSKQEKINIICQTPIKNLVDVYKKFNWNDFLHLNNEKRIEIINNHYKINIDMNNKNLQTFDIIEQGMKKKILSFDVCNLNNKNFRIAMSKIIFKSEEDIVLINSNTSNSKWYYDKYTDFKNELKT